MGILMGSIVPPAYEPGREMTISDTDVLLDANRKTVEGSFGLSMFCKIIIKLSSSNERLGGKKLDNAVCLASLSASTRASYNVDLQVVEQAQLFSERRGSHRSS